MSVLPVRAGQFSDLTSSIIGHLGHWIEPVIRPLGFNWKIGIGLLTSLAARETIVSTLGAIYGMDSESHKLELQNALHHDLTPGGAFALLVFFAFAMQCISTIAVVRRETGGWKWPVLQFEKPVRLRDRVAIPSAKRAAAGGGVTAAVVTAAVVAWWWLRREPAAQTSRSLRAATAPSATRMARISSFFMRTDASRRR